MRVFKLGFNNANGCSTPLAVHCVGHAAVTEEGVGGFAVGLSSSSESALTCEKAFPFLHIKKPTKNPTQTMLPFLMQLVSSWPKRVLGEKCLCLAETQPGCGARWLDAWGRWVLFAVAKSTICLLAVFPKAVWQAVWEENIQKNKISAENGKHVSWHSSVLVYQSPSPVLHLIQHRVFVAARNFIENHQ